MDKDEEFNNYFVLNEDLLGELNKLNIDKYIFTTGKVQEEAKKAETAGNLIKAMVKNENPDVSISQLDG